MLTVLCWRWGGKFGPEYVNRLRNAIGRNLDIPHKFVCVTDDADGIDEGIELVPMPLAHSTAPRCLRRLRQYDATFARELGDRILSIDLDTVTVDNLTPIVDRAEPVVCWKVGFARCFSGSFVLYDAGALDHLWQAFAADPVGFPRMVQPRGIPSDQPCLNYALRDRKVPFWTEADGFVTWFGEGYEHLEHKGMGPNRPKLTPGARIVVLGSADKAVMDDGRYPWVREYWR